MKNEDQFNGTVKMSISNNSNKDKKEFSISFENKFDISLIYNLSSFSYNGIRSWDLDKEDYKRKCKEMNLNEEEEDMLYNFYYEVIESHGIHPEYGKIVEFIYCFDYKDGIIKLKLKKGN